MDSPLEHQQEGDRERRAGGYAGEVGLDADQHRRGHRHWKDGVPGTRRGEELTSLAKKLNLNSPVESVETDRGTRG